MRVSSDGLKIVLVGKKGIRGSREAAAKIRRHGFDNVFLPEKAVTAPGSEIRHAEVGDSAQAFDLIPELGLRPRIQNVETEFSQLLQIGSGSQLVDDGERIELPHRRVGPEAVERQMKPAVLDREFVV